MQSWARWSPRWFVMVLACILAGFLAADLTAQENDFDKTSLTLRTALHYDPVAEGPLQKLVELYRQEGRTEELLSLYTAHAAQYPHDAGSQLVLARLYTLLGDCRAEETFRAAVASHPNHAALAWQYGLYLLQQRHPKAVDEMARALSLEPSASKRAPWLGELMKVAAVQGREDLVMAQVAKLSAENALSADQRLRWARQALQVKLNRTAEKFLQDLDPSALGTEAQVEVVMVRAQLLANTGNKVQAAKELDALLARLAPDYWRRREIFMQRLDVTNEGADRDAMIQAAREKWQAPDGRSESNALMLADVLDASHRRNEALKVLRDAVEKLPLSQVLQIRLMTLWESEGIDEAALGWMAVLREKEPDRSDVQMRELRWWFMAGRSKEALKGFEQWLEKMEGARRVERSVEFGRWLRRRNQLTEAASLLELALKSSPQRWDLRRELAELYFVQRRGDEASRLFDGEWSRDISADARLEIAQFLLVNQRWLEASRFIEPWLAAHPAAFDGHLLMAKIHDRLGQEDKMKASLETARALCDTDARYQAWLETLLEFAKERELLEAWLAEEDARLRGDDPDTLSRKLLLLEQANAREVAGFARNLAETLARSPGLPEEKKLELERARLDLLALDRSRTLEVEQGLRALMEKDERHREDHRLRLAAFYQEMQRSDLAVPLLEKLNASMCTDAAALRRVLGLCQERGMVSQGLACAEKLTALEPAEKNHWVEWMGLLARDSQEERLRVVLREVMGKAHDWQMKPEIIEVLKQHEVASCWRSVLACISGDTADWQAARRMVADMQRLDLTEQQQKWTRWLVAYASAKLGDRPAVEDALLKMGDTDADAWLPFPDGFELSALQAQEHLRKMIDANPLAAEKPASSSALFPPWVMKWGFALDDDQIITRVLVSEQDGMVYIADDRYWLHALDRRTGKLRWRQPTTAGTAVVAVSGRQRGGNMPEIYAPLEMAAADGKVVYLSGDEVVCASAVTGEPLWRGLADGVFDITSSNISTAVSRVTVVNDRVFWWSPMSSSAAVLDLHTGKLLWRVTLTEPPAPLPNRYNGYEMFTRLRSGISVDDETVLVYNRSAALMRISDGGLMWRSGTGEVPMFPIKLETVDAPGSSTLPFSYGSQLAQPQLFIGSGGFGMGMSQQAIVRRRMSPYPVNNSMQRWGYGNSLRVSLQEGAHASRMLLRGDEVWSVSSTGQVTASVMGMPLQTLQQQGVVIGFAGNRLATHDSNQVYVSGTDGTVMTFPFERDEAATAGPGFQPDNGVAAALADSRLYTSSRQGLSLYDTRSGIQLWNGTLPDEVKAWLKDMPQAQEEPAMVNPMMPTMGIRSQRSSRAYLPQGVLVQDERGGGRLVAERSIVTADEWIFPVHDGAIACLSAQAKPAGLSRDKGDEP